MVAHVAPEVRAADALAGPRPEDHQDRLLDRFDRSHRPDPAATVDPEWKRDASAEHAGVAVVVDEGRGTHRKGDLGRAERSSELSDAVIEGRRLEVDMVESGQGVLE